MKPLRNPVSLAHRIRRKGLTVIKLFKGRLLNRSILVFHFSISNRRREITSPTGTWTRSKTRAACYRTHSPLLSSLLSTGSDMESLTEVCVLRVSITDLSGLHQGLSVITCRRREIYFFPFLSCCSYLGLWRAYRGACLVEVYSSIRTGSCTFYTLCPFSHWVRWCYLRFLSFGI